MSCSRSLIRPLAHARGSDPSHDRKGVDGRKRTRQVIAMRILLILAVMAYPLVAAEPYRDPKLPLEQRVDDLVGRLTTNGLKESERYRWLPVRDQWTALYHRLAGR